MGCRHVVRKPTDLPLCVVHQPADTILRLMLINKWAILVWHDVTMAKVECCWFLMPRWLCNSPALGMWFQPFSPILLVETFLVGLCEESSDYANSGRIPWTHQWGRSGRACRTMHSITQAPRPLKNKGWIWWWAVIVQLFVCVTPSGRQFGQMGSLSQSAPARKQPSHWWHPSLCVGATRLWRWNVKVEKRSQLKI